MVAQQCSRTWRSSPAEIHRSDCGESERQRLPVLTAKEGVPVSEEATGRQLQVLDLYSPDIGLARSLTAGCVNLLFPSSDVM